jgi:hypothetical protein
MQIFQHLNLIRRLILPSCYNQPQQRIPCSFSLACSKHINNVYLFYSDSSRYVNYISDTNDIYCQTQHFNAIEQIATCFRSSELSSSTFTTKVYKRVQSLLIIEVSRSHSDTPHSVGLLWTSDQPDAAASTWNHTTLTSDRHPCLFAGFEPSIPASERSQTYAVDRAATGVGPVKYYWGQIFVIEYIFRLFLSSLQKIDMSLADSPNYCHYWPIMQSW